MTNEARHQNLRQIAAKVGERAETQRSAPLPRDIEQQLRHVARIADEVLVFLRPNQLPHDLLDLADMVLRGLDRRLRESEQAGAAHVRRQRRFLEHSSEQPMSAATNG